MIPKTIKNLLSECNQDHVNSYIEYLSKLQTEKKKDGQQWVTKNPWMKHKTDEYLATVFKKVSLDGLVFDGEDITLQNTGVSYSYQAFKNKMFNAYPESVIDVSLVYKNDSFNFSKNSGSVKYSHEISNPFNRSENDITGAYCVIKNKRGEFLTLLSKADIDKHRRVAKTDYIWKSWFAEMALKTIIKKACKQHFKDIFSNIETIDNENYDLENLVSVEEQEQLDTEKFHNEMKWYAVHEPSAYGAVLKTKWQLQTAKQVTKPSSRAGILKEIEIEISNGYPAPIKNKEISLFDTPEWKEWVDTKKKFPEIVNGWQDPVNTTQCLEAVKQVKQIVDQGNA